MMNAKPKSMKTSLISSVNPTPAIEKAKTVRIMRDAKIHVSFSIFLITVFS